MKLAPLPLAQRRRYETPFAAVTLPLRWRRVFVEADVGPSEMVCRECRRPMMPLVPGRDESASALYERFPAIGDVEGGEFTAKPLAASLWACLFCKRGVAVGWSPRG